MIETWRIVTPHRADTAFDGEGAKLYGGRWNEVGTAVVYTASSLALAAMEMLVHLESDQVLARYVAVPVRIPPRLVEKLPASELPGDWREDPVPPQTQALGSRWAKSLRSAVLAVPSCLIPAELNYLLNPAHPQFDKIEIGEALPFDYDSRLIKAPR